MLTSRVMKQGTGVVIVDYCSKFLHSKGRILFCLWSSIPIAPSSCLYNPNISRSLIILTINHFLLLYSSYLKKQQNIIMQTSIAIIAAFFASVKSVKGAIINTQGVPTSCGTASCCIPDCQVSWNDSNGCDGTGSSTGACNNVWNDAQTTRDSGVDICSGAGAFFCYTNGGSRVVFGKSSVF